MAISTSRRASRAVFAVLLGVGGCTIINGFDDVKPLTDGTYEGGTVAASDAQNFADAPGVDSGTPQGAVVMGALAEGDGALTYVLTVLDPETGREMGPRENMVVSAVRYDGERDIWYVFEATGHDFVAGPTEGTILHVRTLDRSTGTWTELSKLPVPTLQSYNSVAVVRERIGYVAYVSPDAGDAALGSVQFASLDTSDPTNIKLLPNKPLTAAPLGVIASRNQTGVGGFVNLVRINQAPGACVGTTCPLELIRVQFPTNGGPPEVSDPVSVGQISRFALPAFASVVSDTHDLLVVPPLAPDAGVTTPVYLLDPIGHGIEGTLQEEITDVVLKPAAVAECQKVALIVATNADAFLHAVPLAAGGTPFKVRMGHSGQAVFFEPFTSTVIAPFSQGTGKDITAFKLEGTPQAPTLRKRTDWFPPDDLRPVVFATRDPWTAVCP